MVNDEMRMILKNEQLYKRRKIGKPVINFIQKINPYSKIINNALNINRNTDRSAMQNILLELSKYDEKEYPLIQEALNTFY